MIDFEQISSDMHERLCASVEKHHVSMRTLSCEMGAKENTLGKYCREKVPDQWVYLVGLHRQGLDIRYILLGIDPNYDGLTSDEMILLKAFRQLTPEGQEALLGLSKAYAIDIEKKQKSDGGASDL